jgi:L-ascorbate metabolism protein UlaG (beta-lactamase superfamily)
LESVDETLVIDPLHDAAAVFAAIGSAAEAVAPPIVPAQAGRAVAGLVTHLHRDHADADALTRALRPDAPVFQPAAAGGDGYENAALAQADKELAGSGLARQEFAPWESTTAGPFTVTALPAVDGIGDPQVSWLVEADGVRVLHLGDTMFHGHWWRMARRHGPFDAVLLPVNGPVVGFPHRQPTSPFAIALDPDQAAVAAQILGARLAIPIHAEGYAIDGLYEPAPAAVAEFTAAAREHGVTVRAMELGETIAICETIEVG